MSEQDSWQERYLALVPERFTAEDVRQLLMLWREDAYRLERALEAYVLNSWTREEA